MDLSLDVTALDASAHLLAAGAVAEMPASVVLVAQGASNTGACPSRCHGITEVLGGTITADSTPNVGSIFTATIATGDIEGAATIDYFDEAATPAELTATQALPSLKGRVLLADDGYDNRELIGYYLRAAGAEVTTAENGSVAVECALDADHPFDVILMDMQMPVMDGLNHPIEAIEHLREIIDGLPDFAEMHLVHRDLGDALRKAGRPGEAVEAYRRSLRSYPNDADVHNNLALALRESGDVRGAIEQFRRALSLDQDAFEAHYNLGDTLAYQGDPAGAATHFGKAVSLKPDDVNSLYRFGELLLRLGRDHEAVQALSRAAALAPDWPLPHNALAWTLATGSKIDPESAAMAVAHARRACELTRRENFSLLDTLAAAYAASGDYEQATSTAEQALALARNAEADAAAMNIAARLEQYRGQQRYQRPRPGQDGAGP